VDLKQQIESALWPECRSSCIVFVDGCLNENFSDISALPSCCALQWSEEMATLSIPPSVAVPVPVQIVSVFSKLSLAVLRLQILLGQNARLDIVEVLAREGISADHIDARLDEGAHLRIADQINSSKKAHLHRFFCAALQRNARLNCFSCSKGALMLQRDWQVFLNGEGAEVDLLGLDDLSKDRQAHTRVCMHHRAPSSRSRQHFKKALQDKSRSNCEGKIRIESTAHHADAAQLCQNLLLSDEASVIVKPFLDIFAADVQAKHGATFSQPTDEELFYCQSRGISMCEAKELWRQGFCREIIDAIEIPAMRQRCL